MGFDGDKKSHRHPERQRRIQGRRCEISYKVCKACHPGLEPVPDLFRDAGVNFLTLRAIPASAGMTSGSSEIFERVGDCTRKQGSREAIATIPASAGMTSGSSEIFERVGDCTRKQGSREAIATSWGSAMKMHKCIFTALALCVLAIVPESRAIRKQSQLAAPRKCR